MVLADSRQITGVRRYSGTPTEGQQLSPTGLSPPTVVLPSTLRLTHDFLTARPVGRPAHTRPTTPNTQPLPGITRAWFSPIRVRSPLLTESLLFSLPAGTEMFHFPAWASHCLCLQQRIGGIHRLGFPIRTSSDHGLLAAPRGLSQLATSFIAF